MLADAADLKLNFDSTIKVLELSTGNAFPLYPRKDIKPDSITVTGASSIEKNKVNFGMPGKNFITLTVQTLNDIVPNPIHLNTSKTKIYFSAQNIFDKQSSIKSINLKPI